MLQQFHKFINENNLFNKNDKILIGVSGGIDSVVLLDLFVKSEFNCTIAHCNFQLRGKESVEDEIFIDTLAQKYNLPFQKTRFETEQYASDNGISIEMAARELRYTWFDSLKKEFRFDFVATAHHLDDSIETFMINLTRGTGVSGLTGIRSRNNYLVRPLMFSNRKKIESYAKENNLEYRMDSSNLEVKFHRNKIRNQIIPLFNEINPSFKDTMISNMQRLQEIEQIYKSAVNQKRLLCVDETGEDIKIDINILRTLNPLRSFLFEFIRVYGFTQQHTDEIIQSFDATSGKQFFSNTHRLVKDRNTLIISDFNNVEYKEYQIDQLRSFIVISRNQIDEIKLNIEKFRKTDDLELSKSNDTAFIDFDKLEFPLIVRKWKDGDFFVPIGMNNRKKLSDFFIDNKVNLIEKDKIWLLTSNDEVVWIINYRLDNRFKISENTKNIFKITSY